MSDDGIPTVAKYTTFLRNVVGVPVSVLPDDSPIIQHTFDQSLNIVDLDIGQLASEKTSWSIYELAVYNLGGHLLIEYAPDISWGIVSATWANGLVSMVTAATTIGAGDQVVVSGLSPMDYNGIVQAKDTPDNTHLVYGKANPGRSPATVMTGAVVTTYFFTKFRREFKIQGFVPGVVSNASDVSTGMGINNPIFTQKLTLFDLQVLKTPWGKAYLAIAQKYGPTIWGLTL